MGESSGAVNRMALRYAFEARISIGVQRGDTNLVVGGWARDISESGMCAFVAEELRVGEFVTLEVPLPQLTRLTIPAKVARSFRDRIRVSVHGLERRTAIACPVSHAWKGHNYCS